MRDTLKAAREEKFWAARFLKLTLFLYVRNPRVNQKKSFKKHIKSRIILKIKTNKNIKNTKTFYSVNPMLK